MQWLLQVHDDLAATGKSQSHHRPDALVVYIGVRLGVDPVATGLYGLEDRLRTVHEFWVGHYNFRMMRIRQILVSVIVLAPIAVAVSGCGQKGALFLPTEPAAAHRATLVQTLRLSTTMAPASAPAAAASGAPTSGTE